ncbi:CRISPR-associated helicase Cas3' [Alcaligenaceae bacterium]|nr:CRISPR-associated helicase Cas3' [Alcaligenaceae bacterium]
MHERYFAHSTDDVSKKNWQPLRNHLVAVSELTCAFAEVFGAGPLGQVAGLLHDIGKYTDDFQDRIAGQAVRVDHATRGAMVAVERYGGLGYVLAYGIAGHHAGLANGAESIERTALQDRLKGVNLPPLLEAWRREVALPEKLAAPKLNVHSKDRSGFQMAFFTRMLFSCLVDADFLDTEAFYDQVGGRASQRAAPAPSMIELRAELNRYLSSLKADRPVDHVRADILAHVRLQAGHSPGLFSLTVPTGGGKTLASLAFALDHAIHHGLRRVIFVIPFTSIVEQNAAVFRNALGKFGQSAVLEHHSAFVATVPPKSDAERYQAQEKLRLAMENWDAPIVVTTAVQFFESLFAARPSQCRKLHNIAGSVVILDEAQTMPLKLLRPAVAAIEELACNYRSSMVLCTATQPALDEAHLDGGFKAGAVRELAPDPASLFRRLDRVRVRHVGELNDEALSEALRTCDQVLCIVNNRRHARALYQSLADMPGARHLTTLMCAKHRSRVLDEVRIRLKNGEPCRLISTSLIEAGVDISLPIVYRAEAGLDSIAQAAGRCNRHGERDAADSEVRVFTNQDWAPPPELLQFSQAAREILRQPQYRDDPLSPPAIEAYFRKLYWQKGGEELDVPGLLALCAKSHIDRLPLETLASKFRMIDSAQMPVIVLFDDEARAHVEGLRHVEKSGGLARKLQSYLVQLPQQAFEALRKTGAIQPAEPEKWGEQFMILVNEDLYDGNHGVSWDDPTFVNSEKLCW